MKSAPDFIQKRQIEHFTKADKEYGQGVQKGLVAARPSDPRQVSVVK